jgi:hypothetical protein
LGFASGAKAQLKRSARLPSKAWRGRPRLSPHHAAGTALQMEVRHGLVLSIDRRTV